LAREAGDTDRVGLMLSNLGYPALLQGDHERVRQLSGEALDVARELGSVGFAPTASINLGLAALGLGEYEQAQQSFQEALVMSQDTGMKLNVIEALEGMASLTRAQGKTTRTARLWGAAEAARTVIGIALPPDEQRLHEPHLASVRSQLGERGWGGALAEGRMMSLEEAAAYALSEEADQPEAAISQDPSSYAEPMDELTPREREVVVLVARGLTNREVSSELSISERTAGNRVAKILKKLGLNSRAQIASWVREK
jgi:DNA-binding CsgD family transcriptional regulator